MCVLSWMYFRLYQFPFRVLRGSLTVPYTLLRKYYPPPHPPVAPQANKALKPTAAHTPD